MSFEIKNLNDIETLRNSNNKIKNKDVVKFQVFKNGDQYYSLLNVLPRYDITILTHIVSVYLHNNDEYLPPIYLAVEGKAGEGKTSQAIASCIQHGFTVIYISASQLSGSHEHDSINEMETVYEHALKRRRSGEKVAIIIDDFHLSNASIDKNMEHTINASLLTGYLMNLTQNKYEDNIPIILTGNDFSQVYSPLMRAGRAELFNWNPNYDEKKEIVKNIFKDFLQCEVYEFESFYARCSKLSIADFAQLKNEYRKTIISNCFNDYKIIDDKAIQKISEQVESKKRKINFQELTELAKQRNMWGD